MKENIINSPSFRSFDLSRFDAAIFDLDGTLIDSMPLWENFCSDWLRSLGKNPEDSLEAVLMTMTISQSADYVNCRYSLDFSQDELISQWEDIMKARYLKGAFAAKAALLKQGAAELLHALAAKGMKLGIATYSFQKSCEAILEHHGVKSYFSSFVYAHEFDPFVRANVQSMEFYERAADAAADIISEFTSVKKDPKFWLIAADRLQAAPEKCIVFEDSVSSLAGVRAAGLKFAAVYDAACSDWPGLSKAADLALNYPGEALKYL
jgi:beta-phosphoglucomutase-like phosphatase (HAD superfamily)